MAYVRTVAIVLSAALLLVTAKPGRCGETLPAAVTPGSYLRISADSFPRPIKGTVTAIKDGRLVVDPGTGEEALTVDLSGVSQMDVRTRESTRGKGAGWGAAAGGLGFLAIVAATDGCGGGLYPDAFCYGSAFIFGGAVGALVGLVAAHGEEWEAVPLVGIPRRSGGAGRQGQFAGRNDGIGVAFSFRF